MTMSVNELPNDPAILKRLLTNLVEQHAEDRRRHAAEAERLLAQIKEEAAQQLEAERAARQTAIDEAVKAAVAAILRRYYGPRSEKFDPRQLLLFGQQIDKRSIVGTETSTN